eukprot:939473-Rhodomonas_salina.3
MAAYLVGRSVRTRAISTATQATLQVCCLCVPAFLREFEGASALEHAKRVRDRAVTGSAAVRVTD